MHHINKAEGTTFIFSTHDEKIIKRADRVIYLEDGLVKKGKKAGSGHETRGFGLEKPPRRVAARVKRGEFHIFCRLLYGLFHLFSRLRQDQYGDGDD